MRSDLWSGFPHRQALIVLKFCETSSQQRYIKVVSNKQGKTVCGKPLLPAIHDRRSPSYFRTDSMDGRLEIFIEDMTNILTNNVSAMQPCMALCVCLFINCYLCTCSY